MEISILSAVMNGLFWASVASLVWLPIQAHANGWDEARALGAGAALTVGAVVVGIVAHLSLSSGRTTTQHAIWYWIPSFAITTLALLAGSAVLGLRSDPGLKVRSYFRQGALIALVFACPVGCAYSYFASALPAAQAEEKQRNAEYDRQHPDTASDGPSDVELIASAKDALRSGALDPDAIRFKEVFVHQSPGKTKAVCGLVNGRNVYGGYAGFRHFVSGGLPGNTVTEDQVKGFRKVWNTLCAA